MCTQYSYCFLPSYSLTYTQAIEVYTISNCTQCIMQLLLSRLEITNQTHLYQGVEGLLQLYPHRHTHTTVLTRHLVDALINSDSQRPTATHTYAHHGVEGLLQLLLLLQEQPAGHTFPLAVTASRGRETCQQHHQAPQRDLHRSAHPDRQAQTGAQQVEEKSLKQGSAGESG